MTLTYQDHSPRERFGLGTMKHTKPETQESLNKNVSRPITISNPEPVISSVPTKVKTNDQESKINELTKLVKMLMDEKINSTQKTQELKTVSSQPKNNSSIGVEDARFGRGIHTSEEFKASCGVTTPKGLRCEVNINTLTIEQYLMLAQGNQVLGIVKTKFGGMMKKNIEDMTIVEYMEYEAEMERQT
ncbi:hypothetical protein Tco_0825594 [Tanacetum coccineum]